MKILQFNNYADPVGGAEVYALALTRELRQRGHTVRFFGTHPDREEDVQDLRVVRRPRYDTALLTRDPATRGALAEAIERLRPDLIHVHNVHGMGVDVLEQLGAAGVPVIQTVHDFSLLCPNSWCVLSDGTPCRGGAGVKCFENDCQKNYPYDAEVALHTLLRQQVMTAVVDLAICPSRYLAELTRSSGVRDVRHLNYFIDPIVSGETGPRAAEELVFIGRLEPEKGVEYLLEAMVHVLHERPGVTLTIVGGGSSSAALQARAQALELGPAVSFKSHVPRTELGRYYATATACVLSSIWSENSPLVAYECLSAGLPMIASRIAGIPELVAEGEAGFTFTPRDADDLARKALALLALPEAERLRMSVAMRARAEAFRAGPHVDQIEELYRETVHVRHARHAPSLAIGADLLRILQHCGQERTRLVGLFHEHVAYIGQLERALAARREEAPVPAPTQAPAASSPAQEPQEPGRTAPRGLLGRLTRALNNPRER